MRLIHLFMFKLFLEVGNENVNKFWAANLPPEEGIHQGASPEQRAIFHRRKYRERRYRKVLEGLNSQEELNQVCVCVLGGSICALYAPCVFFVAFDIMLLFLYLVKRPISAVIYCVCLSTAFSAYLVAQVLNWGCHGNWFPQICGIQYPKSSSKQSS